VRLTFRRFAGGRFGHRFVDCWHRPTFRRFKSALTPDDAGRDQLPLPARNGLTKVWSSAGVVTDIPGLGDLPGVDVVDVPIASRIRRAYALRAMSDTVTQHVHPQGSDELPNATQ
jgi:hypothetical protein